MTNRRLRFFAGFVALVMVLTVVPPVEVGLVEIGPDLAAASATDTSSCDEIAGKDDRSEALRLLCYIRLAKSNPSVCDQSPSPFVCFGAVAGELDDPSVIIENLEGEERDWALAALAVSPESAAQAADLIESNLIHDVAKIQTLATTFAAAQVEGIVLAPPTDYCARNLKGNYDYYADGLAEYGLLSAEEFASNTDMCNTMVAALRQLAYGEESCDAWLPGAIINYYNAADGVQWRVEQCNEMAEDIKAGMSLVGIDLVSKPEVEALKDLAELTGAWVRGGAVINPANDVLHYEGGQGCDPATDPWWYWFCEARYEGKTQTTTPSSTSFVIHDHHKDHQVEYHNVTFNATFTEPPAFLDEGQVVTLPANISRSGSMTNPSFAVMRFGYWPDGISLQGLNEMAIDLVSEPPSIAPSFVTPGPTPGGEFKLTASGNYPGTLVEWTYYSPEPMDFPLPPLTEQEKEKVESVVNEADARPPSEINDEGKQARIVMLDGYVEIQRHGESNWQEAEVGMVMHPGDYIETFGGASARVVVSTEGAAASDEAAVVNISANSTVGMTPLFRPDQEEKGFLDLIRGAIRVITEGWRNSNVYTVKAATTLCHVVGSDVIIIRNPDVGTETVVVNEGHVDLTSVTSGETQAVPAGHVRSVFYGAIAPLEPLGSWWEELIEDEGLDFGGTYRGEPDLALFNPQAGKWHVRYQNGITDSFFYGTPGDTPLMGDWDCDGIDTVAMYRESNGFIYLRNTNDFGAGEREFFYGIQGDIPLAGDWDGDGCDTLGIYRQSKVYLSNSLGTRPADVWFYFGVPGDVPFAGDFNGDGIDTIGLYRRTSGFVYFTNSIPGEGTAAPTHNQFFYGIPSDRIVTGDWDIDGDDTVGIYRGSDETFYISLENRLAEADLTVPFGDLGWLPAAGEFGPGPSSPGDTKDCSQFASQEAAQAWFDYYFPGYGDVAHLDGDLDGQACEGLN